MAMAWRGRGGGGASSYIWRLLSKPSLSRPGIAPACAVVDALLLRTPGGRWSSSSRRHRSAVLWPWGGEELFSGADGEENPLQKAINEVYEDFRSHRHAPKWLPLRPGTSYYVPPGPAISKVLKVSSGVNVGRGVVQSKALSDQEILAALSTSAWLDPDNPQIIVEEESLRNDTKNAPEEVAKDPVAKKNKRQ